MFVVSGAYPKVMILLLATNRERIDKQDGENGKFIGDSKKKLLWNYETWDNKCLTLQGLL